MTTWVLLRGLARESRHWGPFPGLLQAAVQAQRVILLDLPGNGRLHGLQSPATVPGMVAACRAQLRRQGVSGPVHLLAMSLGAMVAVRWAQQASHELAGCVLINTSLRPFSPFWQRLRPRNYPALLRSLLPGQTDADIEQRIWAMTSNHRTLTHGVVPAWAALRHECPVSAANAVRQLWAAARFRAAWAAPEVPVLLLSSVQDRLVDARCSQAIARAWDCAHEQHPSAGHDLPLDAPQWVADQAAQWCRRHIGGS